MKINYERLEIHNFMSFEDQVFDFSEHKGMSLIQGKNNDIPNSRNGVGKSILFGGLLYAVFGQLQNKIKNENLVNRYVSDKDMRLVLNFSVEDNKYKIARGLNKGKNSYLNLFKISDGVETDITKSSIVETQEFLENEILHCDITIFLRTVLLTADQTYNFYMLKKSDKKEFVEKLFDISVFGEMYNVIHKDSLALDKTINSHQNQLLVYNKNCDDYEARIVQYDETKKSKLVQLVESIKTVKTEYLNYKNTEVKTNQEAVDKLNVFISKASEKRTELQTKQRSAEREIGNIDKIIAQLNSKKTSNQSMIDKHKVLLEKLCDDCKPIFKQYHNLDTYSKEISEINEKIESLTENKNKMKSEVDEISLKLSEIATKEKAANDKLKSLTAESIKKNSEMTRLESKLHSMKNDFEKEKSSVNPYIELLENNKKKIEEENEKLNELGIRYNYLKFAENIVSQDTLRKFIIKDLVVLLNNRIKTYLTKLGAKYYVVFNEDMDYDFITSNGGSCEFGNFSAGERMRLMIATSFAFRDFMSIRNGLNSNILILDEYFDSAIDSLCVESILKILEEYKQENNQNIYVISHRSEVNIEMFDNIIQVEKTNNITKVNLI